MFEPIDVSINWGFIGILCTLLIILIRFLKKVYSPKMKQIDFREEWSLQGMSKPIGFEELITISYQGEEVESFHGFEIVLFNSGNDVINFDDFNEYPTIELSGFNNILKLEVFKSCKYTECEVCVVGENQMRIELNNFESRCYIKITIHYESIEDILMPSIAMGLKNQKKVDYKHLDINYREYVGIGSDYTRLMGVAFIAFLVPLIITYLFVRFGLGIDFENANTYPWEWKLLFFIPALITMATIVCREYRMVEDYHFGSHKIKDWYQVDISNIK